MSTEDIADDDMNDDETTTDWKDELRQNIKADAQDITQGAGWNPPSLSSPESPLGVQSPELGIVNPKIPLAPMVGQSPISIAPEQQQASQNPSAQAQAPIGGGVGIPKEFQNYLNLTEKAGTEEQAQRAAAEKQKQDIYAQQMKDIQDSRNEANAKFQNHLKEMDAIHEEEKKAGPISAQRLFKNMGTANKVVMGIGLALSALHPGGIQSAMKIIDDATNRDIDEQKANHMMLQTKKQESNSSYAQQMTMLGSDQQARLAEKMLQLKNVDSILDQKLAGTNSDRVKANGQLMKGQIMQQQKALASQMYQNQVNNGLLDRQANAIDPKQLYQMKDRLPKQVADRVTPMGLAKSAKDAEELQSKALQISGSINTLERIKQDVKQLGLTDRPGKFDRLEEEAKIALMPLVFEGADARGIPAKRAAIDDMMPSIRSIKTLKFSPESFINFINTQQQAGQQKVENAKLLHLSNYKGSK